eukprot:403340385
MNTNNNQASTNHQATDQNKIQSFLDQLDEIMNDRYEKQKQKYANECNFDIDHEQEIPADSSSTQSASGSNQSQNAATTNNSTLPSQLMFPQFKWSILNRENDMVRRSSSPTQSPKHVDLQIKKQTQLQLSEKKKPLAQERISQFTNASTNYTNTLFGGSERNSIFGILTDRSRLSFANQAPPDLSRLSSAHENLLFDRKMPQISTNATLKLDLNSNSNNASNRNTLVGQLPMIRQNNQRASEALFFENSVESYAQTSRHRIARHIDFRAYSQDIPTQLSDLKNQNEVTSQLEVDQSNEEEKKFETNTFVIDSKSRKDSFQDRNQDTGNPSNIPSASQFPPRLKQSSLSSAQISNSRNIQTNPGISLGYQQNRNPQIPNEDIQTQKYTGSEQIVTNSENKKTEQQKILKQFQRISHKYSPMQTNPTTNQAMSYHQDYQNQMRQFQTEDNIFGRQVSHFDDDNLNFPKQKEEQYDGDDANIQNSDDEDQRDNDNEEFVITQKVYESRNQGIGQSGSTGGKQQSLTNVFYRSAQKSKEMPVNIDLRKRSDQE